jgi:hypothetical protein
MTYYAFNTKFSAVAKLDSLEGTELVNHKTTKAGPSGDNRAAPIAFASDDFDEFLRQAGAYGLGSAAAKLRHQSGRGWFWQNEDGILEVCGGQ